MIAVLFGLNVFAVAVFALAVMAFGPDARPARPARAAGPAHRRGRGRRSVERTLISNRDLDLTVEFARVA